MTEKPTRPGVPAGADWAHDMLSWPFNASRLALDSYLQWLAGPDLKPEPAGEQAQAPLSWTTPNTVALELASMRLRDFSQGAGGRPLLVCAPYALHGALIADFASGHSVVEALREDGARRVYLTDWRPAASDMRYFSIDNYLSDLNVAIDEIGAPVDLVGLCQGGWLSLIYAARFTDKVRRLVLAGAPVDISVPSALSEMARSFPKAAFDALVREGGGIVSGRYMHRFWSIPFSLTGVEAALQSNLSDEAAESKALLDRFARWESETLDLPGTYYLEVIDWIFRENRIAAGRFTALGRRIDLRAMAAPVFLLAGARDDVVPPEQALATAPLLGTPAARLERAIEPCGHLALFMGGETLRHAWRRIARWLDADLEEGGEPCTEVRPAGRAQRG